MSSDVSRWRVILNEVKNLSVSTRAQSKWRASTVIPSVVKNSEGGTAVHTQIGTIIDPTTRGCYYGRLTTINYRW